jgi:hypothetical protein
MLEAYWASLQLLPAADEPIQRLGLVADRNGLVPNDIQLSDFGLRRIRYQQDRVEIQVDSVT